MTEDSRKHMLTFKSESVIRHHILQFTTDFAIRSSAQRNHAVPCTQQQIQTFFFCKELLDIPGGITRCRAKLFRGAIEVLMCWSSKFILDIDLSNEATKLTKATTSAWPASTKTSAHISAAWDHITATQSSQVQKSCKAIFHQCSSYFHMFPKIYRIAHRFPRFLLFVFLAFQTRFEVVLASKKKIAPHFGILWHLLHLGARKPGILVKNVEHPKAAGWNHPHPAGPDFGPDFNAFPIPTWWRWSFASRWDWTWFQVSIRLPLNLWIVENVAFMAVWKWATHFTQWSIIYPNDCSRLLVKNKTLLQWQARLGLPISSIPEIGTFNERALYTWKSSASKCLRTGVIYGDFPMVKWEWVQYEASAWSMERLATSRTIFPCLPLVPMVQVGFRTLQPPWIAKAAPHIQIREQLMLQGDGWHRTTFPWPLATQNAAKALHWADFP
jgi:hypothetical protein